MWSGTPRRQGAAEELKLPSMGLCRYTVRLGSRGRPQESAGSHVISRTEHTSLLQAQHGDMLEKAFLGR